MAWPQGRPEKSTFIRNSLCSGSYLNEQVSEVENTVISGKNKFDLIFDQQTVGSGKFFAGLRLVELLFQNAEGTLAMIL